MDAVRVDDCHLLAAGRWDQTLLSHRMTELKTHAERRKRCVLEVLTVPLFRPMEWVMEMRTDRASGAFESWGEAITATIERCGAMIPAGRTAFGDVVTAPLAT